MQLQPTPPQPRLPLLLVLLCSLVLVQAASGVRADDCSVREPARDDPKWKCRKATSFKGPCIPSGAFAKWGCLELDSDAMLCDDGGAFNMTAYLAHDGVTLDCNGQVIDHGSEPDKRRPGVRTPYRRSVSNITIRNCTIRNAKRYGVDLKRFFRGAELQGEMTGHSDIRLENVHIEAPEQWGIYVGQNSRRMSISDCTIDGAYGGIYLEAGSAQTSIARCTIENSQQREAIAIDSSSRNVVEDCLFEGNSDAIQVYKNCGENWGQVCPIPRTMDASDNILRRNTFVGDDVHVAFRQYKLYGIGFCSSVGLVGYWRDRAQRNIIEGNLFDGADLDVDDGPVLVFKNRFRHGSQLGLGSLRPPFYFASAVAIAGILAQNTFEDTSRMRYDTRGVYDRLYVFNNRDGSGNCLDDNACDRSSSALQDAVDREPAGLSAMFRYFSAPEPAGTNARAPATGKSSAAGAARRTITLRPKDRARPPQPRFKRGVRLSSSARRAPLCTGCR